MASNPKTSTEHKEECANSEHHDTSKQLQPIDGLGNKSLHLYDEHGTLRLIPTPSADPNDPLKLPTWRKYLVIAALGLYTAGATSMLSSISPIIPSLFQYYAMVEGPPPTLQMIMNLATFPTLCGGVAAIIGVIVARWIGTRPVVSFSAVLTFVCTIWACVSTGGSDRGLKSHIAARCFVGFGSGAFETVVPLMIQDMNYIHTRNTLIAIVWAFGGIGSAVFGVASSYIVAALDWRWFFGIINIVTGTGMILILLVVPETSWTRTARDLTGTSETDENGFAEPVRPSGRNRSYLYSLRMISGHGSGKMAWDTFIDLLRCSLFPNVIWIVLLNSCMGGTTIATTLVTSTLLQTSYHWESKNLGLFTFVMLIGSFFTIPITGFLGDQVIKYMAKRNNGQHKPEHQLVNLVLPAILGFIGTICYGAFATHPEQYHWAALLAMMTFQYFCFFSINVISTTYVIECFPDLAGVMVVAAGAYRNIVGFGLTYGVQDFVAAAGYLGCFGTYAGIQGLLGIAGIFFYFKGPAVRAYTSQSRLMKSRRAHIHEA
ncbi:major facilitator superfamily domain-containing protein [Bisporella sp. PMI_857]|nr:major facilitator superfamily domain-containing protein [Bisporella sp. PMI_857]